MTITFYRVAGRLFQGINDAKSHREAPEEETPEED